MNVLLMPFLYFPEDKTEYISAGISMFFFGVLMVLTFMWIRRKSKKQELEAKEFEERILRERREQKEKQHPQN